MRRKAKKVSHRTVKIAQDGVPSTFGGSDKAYIDLISLRIGMEEVGKAIETRKKDIGQESLHFGCATLMMRRKKQFIACDDATMDGPHAEKLS